MGHDFGGWLEVCVKNPVAQEQDSRQMGGRTSGVAEDVQRLCMLIVPSADFSYIISEDLLPPP